jgi:hypothetical protein
MFPFCRRRNQFSAWDFRTWVQYQVTHLRQNQSHTVSGIKVSSWYTFVCLSIHLLVCSSVSTCFCADSAGLRYTELPTSCNATFLLWRISVPLEHLRQTQITKTREVSIKGQSLPTGKACFHQAASDLTPVRLPRTALVKKTPWHESASELYRWSDRRLSAKLVSTFVDRGCHVVSVTDPYGRILDFLDRTDNFGK